MQSAKRKCLHLVYSFMDRDLGLIHVRVQTQFPLQIQVYLDGHEWLARKLTARGIEHTKIDRRLRPDRGPATSAAPVRPIRAPQVAADPEPIRPAGRAATG